MRKRSAGKREWRPGWARVEKLIVTMANFVDPTEPVLRQYAAAVQAELWPGTTLTEDTMAVFRQAVETAKLHQGGAEDREQVRLARSLAKRKIELYYISRRK